jgi:P-type Ca2+ transporter type 2C
MVFCTLCFSQMAHVVSIRSDRYSIFQQGLFSNIPLLWAVLLTFVLQLATVYLPVLQPIFSTQSLSVKELSICIGSASVILIAVEIEKMVKRIKINYQAQNKM